MKILTLPIVILCITLSCNVSKTNSAQKKQFAHRFNPMASPIHEVEKPLRGEICLNGNWQFMPVFENDIQKFTKPETFHWEETPIKIPSPWNVNAFPQGVPTSMDNGNNLDEGGDFLMYPSYPENWGNAEIGWMRKTFTLPENWQGKQHFLHFEAIAGYAKIYVNGKLAIENLDIFFPTKVNVTDFLKNGENEILVGVARASLTNDEGKYGRRKYVAGSFWGKKIAGIWQDVYLFSYPETYISDVFVKPDVANKKLEFELTIQNSANKPITISVGGNISKWINLAGEGTIEAPVQKGELGSPLINIDFSKPVQIEANSTAKVTLEKEINNELNYWTPETPNLYGAVLQLKAGNEIIDNKYERFGWRQFTIKCEQLLLNGEPIVLKGDSWHFMGIPQMTRRYAWGWYKMLKDANANAVRLHAQPYPSFYLDVADEMGICVLDETAIWSSDGGPKMDSEEYWKHCRGHVESMVLRDRNHPSVFGWSVCNETLPVAIHVFHAPESIVQRQVDEINEWVALTQKLDPTRDWISGDGETLRKTNLPTIIGHYGGENALKEWSSQGMPWGVGETGMAYYGTPRQIAKVNGDRAYESQLGRMEGLATEAYDLIGKQLKYNASYTSVFNVIWYGLKPLEIGLGDVSKKSTPEDGIFFPAYKEGIPGVQPERIGPYSTTINPGYDVNLPLYKPWPLFHAVKAAFAEPVEGFKVEEKIMVESKIESIDEAIEEVVFFSGIEKSPLKEKLASMGMHFTDKPVIAEKTLVVIDGKNPAKGKEAKPVVNQVMEAGGKVIVLGVSEETVNTLNKILPVPIELTNRKATSFIKKEEDVFVKWFGNKDFYFTEMVKSPVMDFGLSGKLVEDGQVILEACNTDWSGWNYRPEFLKTATTYRSELEEKPEGAALVKYQQENGTLYLSSINLLSVKESGARILKRMISNLGVVFKSVDLSSTLAIDKKGRFAKALFCGAFDASKLNLEQMAGKEFIAKNREPQLGGQEKGKFWEVVEVDENGAFDFRNIGLSEHLENSVAYLSFWIYSPRSLVNLLAEPDMPRVDMVMGADDGFVLYLNGKETYVDDKPGGWVKDEYVLEQLPLDKGWNHLLVKSTQLGHDWKFSAYLKSDNKTFLQELSSALEN